MTPTSLTSATVATTALATQSTNQSEKTPSADDIVQKCLRKLSAELSIGPVNSSHAFSRVSLEPLLGMILAAMGDSSRKEAALGLPKGSLTPTLEKDIHDLFGKTSRRYASGDHPCVVSTNFLLSSLQRQNPAFDRVLRESYSVETETASCQNVADATDDLIRRKTENQITGIFTEMCPIMRSNMVLTLGNVLLFKGLWSESFDKDDTQPGEFRCADDRTIKNIKMMELIDSVPSAEYGDFRAIAKDFIPDSDLSLRFVAIQPSDPLLTSIDELDNDTITVLLNRLAEAWPEEFKLRIPKIEIDCTEDQLLDKLSSLLGIRLTAEELCELRLNPSDHININNALRVSLGEEGVDGSVANVLYEVTRSAGSTNYSEFFFDRPGYIAIVEGSDNRLVEATIKDGEYLEADGPLKVYGNSTPTNSPDNFSDTSSDTSSDTYSDTSSGTTSSGSTSSGSTSSGSTSSGTTSCDPNPSEKSPNSPFSDTVPDSLHDSSISDNDLEPLKSHEILDTSSDESCDLHPVGKKRGLEDSSETTEPAPKPPRLDVITLEYQPLLNKRFNHDGAVHITEIKDLGNHFKIRVDSKGGSDLLMTRILDNIGQDKQLFVDTIDYETENEHYYSVVASFHGRRELISYLKQTPN